MFLERIPAKPNVVLISSDEHEPSLCFICKKLSTLGDLTFYLSVDEPFDKNKAIFFDFNCLISIKALLDDWAQQEGYTYVSEDFVKTPLKWDA